MERTRNISINFSRSHATQHRGWLKYFAIALGAGMGAAQAQERVVHNYWWVMPHDTESRARVLRVMGEKGGSYEPVNAAQDLDAMQNNPVIAQARLERQAALRREALRLAAELRAKGKSPKVAYEEAWTRVYKSCWLNANWGAGSSRLEELMDRLVSGGDAMELSPQEVQWLLEALLEDDDRLETREGVELIQHLVTNLRKAGYGLLKGPNSVQDEIMLRFAAALRHGESGVSAYKDALFKTHRDSIMLHQTVGYCAPWGTGLGPSRAAYRQAPVKAVPSAGTANIAPLQGTSSGVQVDFTAGMKQDAGKVDNFLATAPEEEEKDKETTEQQEQEENTNPGETTGLAASSPMTLRSAFSLRAAAPSTYAANDGIATAATGDIVVTGNASYHVNAQMELGDRNGATWKTDNNKSGSGGWRPSTLTYAAWSGGSSISGSVEQIDLQGGNLYLGTGYTGVVHVVDSGTIHAEGSETKTTSGWWSSVSAVVPVAGSGVFNYGTLSGSGTLTLTSNAASNNAVIYIFNDAGSGNWFSGKVQFGASQGGIVQLDLGKGGASTRWSDVEFDMSPMGKGTEGYSISSSTAPSRTILNIRGAVTIAGLTGGNANSTVTSESTDTSYTLTLGENSASTYTYGGTFKGTFYNDSGVLHNSPAGLNLNKVGSNTQVFSADMGQSQALHHVNVQGGILKFADAYVNTVHVSAGELAAENLTSLGSAYVTDSAAEEVVVSGSGYLNIAEKLAVTDDLVVLEEGRLTASALEVGSDFTLSSNLADKAAVSISGASVISGDANVEYGRYETNSLQVAGSLSIGADRENTQAYVKAHDIIAGTLRLRGDGSLETTGAVSFTEGQYLHAGSSWTMAGTSNVLGGSMNVRHLHDGEKVNFSGSGTQEGAVVLTMPGYLDFADSASASGSSWNDAGSAVFHLDGVTLDFGSTGVTTIRNIGFSVTEGTKITLATTEDGNGWFSAQYPSIKVQSAGQDWHGVLGYENGNIVITIEHVIDTPFTVLSGGQGYENKQSGAAGVVYIRMDSNNQGQALPVLAYDDATYSSRNGWSDATPVPNANLLAFTNVEIGKGGKVYMAETGAVSGTADYREDLRFDGNISVAADDAQLHGEIGTWGRWMLGGTLGGSGALKLVAHNGAADTASIFTFTGTQNASAWLNGTVSMADPTGGMVQLNVGNANIAGKGDTRWKNVVIDMGRASFKDSVVNQTGTASRLVLAVEGNTTIKGLSGGDASTQVVSGLRATSYKAAPVLTIGCNGEDYSFAGTVGSGSYYLGGKASSSTVGEVTTETNHYTTREGSIRLVKTGSNKQTFTGKVNLESAEVQAGTLAFSGTTQIDELIVRSGATVQTGNALTLGSASLYGGATWQLTSSADFSSEPISLLDADGGSVNITSSGNKVTWTTMKQLDLAEAGELSAVSPLFTMGNNVSLTLSNTLNITNAAGVEENSSLALYKLSSGQNFTLGSQTVLVMDDEGRYYNASFRYDGGTVYVDIKGLREDYGIIVNPAGSNTASQADAYYWSGMASNGSSIEDVDHMGITMGHVWCADGSAENTGWHEQRIGSVAPGVYENGYKVVFSDYTVHHYTDNPADKTSPYRIVHVQGKVAPGEMLVCAENDAAKIGAGEAEMKYGYAFISADGSAYSRISDVTDDQGDILQRTHITKTGDSVLILHMPNDFTGGIDVQDGTLYLTRPGAAGYGALVLHNDAEWIDYWDKTDDNASFVSVARKGVELMVNYEHSSDVASAYRNPRVMNSIVLEGTDTGYVTISYARATYKEDLNNFTNVPRHWRNLNLTGGIFGDGNLQLRGYTSSWYEKKDASYVSSFSINKSQYNEALVKENLNGQAPKAFTGTVTLHNTVNWSRIDSDKLNSRTAGSVQLCLQDDVFSAAHIDLTREEVDKAQNGVEDNRQTYANILVVNGTVGVGALSSVFLKSAYHTNSNNYQDKTFNTEFSQADERWRVRTVTGSQSTLVLGRENDEATYVYSGTMGFAQSYTQAQQPHIMFGNGLETMDTMTQDFKNIGSFSNGVETLSLVKQSATTQYIHSAVLNDISVYQGALGFNYLNMKGNLNMVDGTMLHLGVTGDLGVTGGEMKWTNVTGTSYNTNNTVALGSGKTFTVLSSDDLQAATVEGNVTMQSGSALTFLVNGSTPYSLSIDEKTAGHESEIIPLLTVTGTLALQANQNISLTFDNVNFSSGQKYYLAAADAITVGGSAETSFGTRMVTLGYGYFGRLYTVGDSGCSIGGGDSASTDYLVMTVSGDPRHTWSGSTDGYEWKGTAYRYKLAATTERYDYKWKENTEFINGDVVLFGNLYTPTEWTETARLNSDESVQVLVQQDGASVSPNMGVLVQETKDADTYDFNIDGYSVEELGTTVGDRSKGFQAVNVQGRVAPFIVMINANYETESRTGEVVTTLNLREEDGTNYYFYTTGTGCIDNATVDELREAGFDVTWKTMLHKTGTGTTVMALDNRYTGGTVLQGEGIMVMQHVNALGYVYDAETQGRAGEGADEDFVPYEATITLMDGAALQGDFNDADFVGNYQEGSFSQGKFMSTTTINNKIVVNDYADPTNPDYAQAVDGRLINSYSKKLIIRELVGEADTVLELNGVSRSDGDLYHYGVFKVLDPSRFYGTITMNGQEWGKGSNEPGGKVQLDIMSTAKSAEGADWTNATIDLSVNATTARTVLGLDVTSSGEVCVVDSINGTIREGGSSSVLNLSNHFAAVLQLEGMRNGDYDGVFGYGDFQVAVNYGGYSSEDMGKTKHHYGAESWGTLDVIKKGDATTQSVRRAWLDDLIVEGGGFQVDEALVARSITAGGTTRVFVGEVDTYTLYTLAVGKGGILAMNTTFEETGAKTDALAGVSAGTDLGAAPGQEEGVGAGSAWVRLENGATLSAREDWFTARQVDIYNGASVTINTHNLTIDPYILTGADVQQSFIDKRDKSHIIQLLGKVTGSDVSLSFNNWMISPETNKVMTGDFQYVNYMGYAALNDLNDFGGSSTVNVEAMTVLQILQGNGGAMADVDITVAGVNATLQILDKEVTYTLNSKTGKYDESIKDSMVQYIDDLELGHNLVAAGENPNTTDPLVRTNNGQLILGGTEMKELKPEDSYISTPKLDQMQVLFTTRHNSTDENIKGHISGMHVDMRGNAVKMGGTESATSNMENLHVDMADKSVSHTVHHADLSNTMVHLLEDCSVNIAETVMLRRDSVIRGAWVAYDAESQKVIASTMNPKTDPAAATGADSLRETIEVTTSVDTTVQLTFAGQETHDVNGTNILVLLTDQFQGVDIQGSGLTIQLQQDISSFLAMGYSAGARFIAIQIGGGAGRFEYESLNGTQFAASLDGQYVLLEEDGSQVFGHWVTSSYVSDNVGFRVTPHMLYFEVPEPATATLSLLALTALCARRRRK